MRLIKNLGTNLTSAFNTQITTSRLWKLFTTGYMLQSRDHRNFN
jgi:hypothetical protein